MTNLERWMRRFRTGAAVAYRWELMRHGEGEEPRWLLRAVRPDDLPFPTGTCPLAMQGHLDRFPSMLGREMYAIIAAADDEPEADQAIRHALLQSCGLKEKD